MWKLSDTLQYFKPRVHQYNSIWVVKKLSSAFSLFLEQQIFNQHPLKISQGNWKAVARSRWANNWNVYLEKDILHLKLTDCQLVWKKKNIFWFLKLGLYFPFKTSLIKILIEANPFFYSLCQNKKLPLYHNGKLVTVNWNSKRQKTYLSEMWHPTCRDMVEVP